MCIRPPDAMESTELIEPVADEKSTSESKEFQLEKIEDVELPPEKICWYLTLMELYFHVGTLYSFKLMFDGRVQLSTLATGEALSALLLISERF